MILQTGFPTSEEQSQVKSKRSPKPALSLAGRAKWETRAEKMVIYEMEETPSSLLPYLLDVVVDVYEGERSSDNLPHGSGRCTFKNGSTYEGTWSEGFLQGQGTYVWKDGVQFKGDFNRNEI